MIARPIPMRRRSPSIGFYPAKGRRHGSIPNHRSGGFNDSLRKDIPKEKVSEWASRVKGAKFLWLDPAWIDELGAIRDIIKKALASAGKGK